MYYRYLILYLVSILTGDVRTIQSTLGPPRGRVEREVFGAGKVKGAGGLGICELHGYGLYVLGTYLEDVRKMEMVR